MEKGDGSNGLWEVLNMAKGKDVKIYVKTSVNYRFCDTCVFGFLEKNENLESSVLSALT